MSPPDLFLKDFTGYLQTDAYGAYDHFSKTDGITLVGCMAHARRKFKDANDQKQKGADEAMDMFGELYAIERQARDQQMDNAHRLELRIEKSIPVMTEVKPVF